MSNILNEKVTLKQIFSDGGEITADERNELENLVREVREKTGQKFDYTISERGYVTIPTWSVYHETGDPKYGASRWSIGVDFMSEQEAKVAVYQLNLLYTTDEFRNRPRRFVYDKAMGMTLDKSDLKGILRGKK